MTPATIFNSAGAPARSRPPLMAMDPVGGNLTVATVSVRSGRVNV
jgi:hypothetical protein